MINNINSFNGGQPLSAARGERAEKIEKALDDMRVKLAALGPGELAAKRDYGHSMVDDISAARFQQPASGQSEDDFAALSARLMA